VREILKCINYSKNVELDGRGLMDLIKQKTGVKWDEDRIE